MLNIRQLLRDGLEEYLRSKVKLSPRYVNRISDIAHPCERYLYYSRVDWDKATTTPPSLQGIFETGNTLESIIARNFNMIGESVSTPFRVVGTQLATNDNLLQKYNISGTVDGLLQVKEGDKWETLGAIDIKTSSPNVYPKLQGKEDLDRFFWTQKYVAQIMLYSLANNLGKCYLLFANKSNLYDMNVIDFDVDFEYCESLLQKAERINKAVDAKEPPCKLNKPDECKRCRFEAHCIPEITPEAGIKIIVDDNVHDTIHEWYELKKIQSDYKEAEKKLDEVLIPGQDIVCGEYFIEWSERKRGDTTYFVKKVVNTNEQEEG